MSHKFNTFLECYKANLYKAIQAHPEDYPWASEPTIIYGNTGVTVLSKSVEQVANKMGEAIQKGSFNKDGHAMKATFKELGIPYTYKALNIYLER